MTILREPFSWPREKQNLRKRAVVLEWVTIGALITIIAAMYFTMGSSQAMKTAWLEDLLSLVPPIAFLVALRIERIPPGKRFPWGFLRAGSVGYLVASTALLGMAVFMIFESVSALTAAEHPTIGAVTIFGHTVWLGWLMCAALIYSVIPPVILGRLKQPVAQGLYDKVLHADAEMNRADWLTGLAAIAGVLGIGMGLWWADSVAALIIALDVARDGIVNMGRALCDILDRQPRRVTGDKPDPVLEKVADHLQERGELARHGINLRTEGRAITGTILVVPREGAMTPEETDRLRREVEDLDWRLYDLAVVPAPLDAEQQGVSSLAG